MIIFLADGAIGGVDFSSAERKKIATSYSDPRRWLGLITDRGIMFVLCARPRMSTYSPTHNRIRNQHHRQREHLSGYPSHTRKTRIHPQTLSRVLNPLGFAKTNKIDSQGETSAGAEEATAPVAPQPLPVPQRPSPLIDRLLFIFIAILAVMIYRKVV
jgi:hypothetical protein